MVRATEGWNNRLCGASRASEMPILASDKAVMFPPCALDFWVLHFELIQNLCYHDNVSTHFRTVYFPIPQICQNSVLK
jgi:hypothetical protein